MNVILWSKDLREIILLLIMINNELLNFIKERVSQGTTKEQISDMLVTHGGWDAKDVDEAFDTIGLLGSSMPSIVSSMTKMADVAKISTIQTPVEEKPVNPVRPISIGFDANTKSLASNLNVTNPVHVSQPISTPVTIVSPIETPITAKPVTSPIVTSPLTAPAPTITATPAVAVLPIVEQHEQTPIAVTHISKPTEPVVSNISFNSEKVSDVSEPEMFTQKTLEPTIQTSPITTEKPRIIPSASPVISPTDNERKPSASLNTGVISGDTSLAEMRARFAAGASVTPVTPPVETFPKQPAVTSSIQTPNVVKTSPFQEVAPTPSVYPVSQNPNLSPHTQSGMIPTMNAQQSSPFSTSAVKPIQRSEPATFAPMPARKLSNAVISNQPMSTASRKNSPPAKKVVGPLGVMVAVGNGYTITDTCALLIQELISV